MDINYIKQLNRNLLIEYLLTQNFTAEAQILEARDIDGDNFLTFTEEDLVQWRLSVYQKKLILNCRDKILRKSLISALSIKPNLEKEKLEQNKASTNFVSKSYKKESPNTLRTPQPLPGPSKEISDNYYDVPSAAIVPINPGLEKEKLQFDHKTLGATNKQNNTETPNSFWSLSPALPENIGSGKSVDSLYDVPAAIPRPYVPINSIKNIEPFQQNHKTLNAVLQSSNKGEPDTVVGSQKYFPDHPKKNCPEKNIDIQYEVPIEIPHRCATISQNNNLHTALQQTPTAQPYTLEKLRPLQTVSKEIYSVKSVESPEMSTTSKPTVPKNPTGKDSFKQELLAALESNKKGKSNIVRSQQPLLDSVKESFIDKSSNRHDVPIVKPVIPINSKVEKEQLKQARKTIFALESSKVDKPNILGTKSISPFPPKEMFHDKNIVDHYEVAPTNMLRPIASRNPMTKMIPNPLAPINTNLQKLKKDISMTLEASLQPDVKEKPHIFGSQRFLPVPLKAMSTDNNFHNQHEEPKIMHNSNVPINPNLDREKLNKHLSKILVASLEANTRGAPLTLKGQKPLQVPPKEMSTNNSFDDQYEVPEMIHNASVSVNSHLQKEKTNKDTSKLLNASLYPIIMGKPPMFGNQRPLPATPQNMCSRKSLENDNNKTLWYIDKENSKTDDIENTEYVDMSLKTLNNDDMSLNFKGTTQKIPVKPKHLNQNCSQEFNSSARTNIQKVPKKPQISLTGPRQPVLSLDDLNTPSTSRGTVPLQQSLSGNGTVEVDNYLSPNLIDFSDLKSSDRSRSPLLMNWGATRDYPQNIGKTYPSLPEKPKTIPFTGSDEENDNNYERLPDMRWKQPMKDSIQNTPLPPIPSPTPAYKTDTPMLSHTSQGLNITKPIEKTPTWSYNKGLNLSVQPDTEDMVENRHEIQSDPWDFDVMDLPIPPPPDPDFSYGQDKENVWSVVDQTVLPRPPRLSLNEDHITRIRDFFADIDRIDTPSSDEELFYPNDYIYYRNTDRKGARELLETVENLKSDTFVLRPSTKRSYFLGLTIFHEEYFYNLGIYRDVNGKLYGQSLNEKETAKFDMIESFIDYYKYNPLVVKKRDGKIVELYLKHFLPANIF